MKSEIINDLSIDNKSGNKTRENYIKNHYLIDYENIIKINFVNNWNEKLYCYVNNVNEVPTCSNKNCSNHVKFKKYSEGYRDYCSIQCRNSDSKFKLFGESNPMKISENVVKAKQTKKNRYDDENFVNSDKAKLTKKKKYLDENYNNRNKFKRTTFEKYGVEGFTNREKAKNTSLIKYKNEFYNNRKKHVETNLTKYGVKYYNNREKAKNTCQNKYGCESFVLSNEYRQIIFNKTKKKYADILNIDVNNIDYDGENFTIKMYCKIHEIFKINRYILKNRIAYGIEELCTACNPISDNCSIKELEVNNFISNELGIETIKHKISNKEIDIFLPKYNLGIEFDGLYWHSSLMIKPNQHQIKTDLCEKNGIHLLHIFENEWIMKKNIVKSIIKSKLGIIDNKIYARKTEIMEIFDNQLVKNFLKTNHIQGFVESKIKIGLFYNNELVSLMTFGKKRLSLGNSINNNDEYEMLRFCNKLNTSVVGGASKMLKYFIKKYQPNSIMTFADRRYSQGNLYKQLGFLFIKNTIPNYWYFKPHEYMLQHRFKFRKDVLIKEGFDPTKTEHQIMAERGYSRIYDSGSMKFELKLR